VDDSQVGSLTGTVDSALIASKCADASASAGAVYVFSDAAGSVDDFDGDAGDPVATSIVDLNTFKYTVAFLEAGDYLVA